MSGDRRLPSLYQLIEKTLQCRLCYQRAVAKVMNLLESNRILERPAPSASDPLNWEHPHILTRALCHRCLVQLLRSHLPNHLVLVTNLPDKVWPNTNGTSQLCVVDLLPKFLVIILRACNNLTDHARRQWPRSSKRDARRWVGLRLRPPARLNRSRHH